MRKLIGIALILACGSVQAVVEYEYSGAPNYDDITDQEPPSGTYTTAMSVAGSFTVPGALSPMALTDISGSVTSYSFTDGRQNLTNANSDITTFLVAVDGSGQISEWRIEVDDRTPYTAVGDKKRFIVTKDVVTQSFSHLGQISECETFTTSCNLARSDLGFVRGIGKGTWTSTIITDTLSCEGFGAPINSGPVTVKKNRVLPFTGRLVDASSQFIDDLGVTSVPVVQVLYDDGTPPADDVSGDALPAGAGTNGNQFEFLGGGWQYNLKTKNYSAPGTYTVTMESGDADEYLIDPTCTATFVIN